LSNRAKVKPGFKQTAENQPPPEYQAEPLDPGAAELEPDVDQSPLPQQLPYELHF
jgi:hypothetical protein